MRGRERGRESRRKGEKEDERERGPVDGDGTMISRTDKEE